jgi:hypothetical protein
MKTPEWFTVPATICCVFLLTIIVLMAVGAW